VISTALSQAPTLEEMISGAEATSVPTPDQILAPAIRDLELVKTLRREDSQGSNHSSRDRLDSSHPDSHRILLVHRDRKDPV
jgi:hypothetical protein